ncbi:hypothetical protein J7E24_07340 [Hymenobacter sp. ISL-91]|uniref:hypothetical protein n=1 Tax=Hymenobacter sp. ISL-91 TaxID=2819151 RepID=UPI001BEB87B5|nr:hypothetical protein [Hymenobacter sp. ISL-91]MBT2557592.1 hypothetical protein [Hymenobacter sp. ISL-91]
MLPFLTNGQSLPAPEKTYKAAFNHIKHDRQLRQMGYNLKNVAVFDSIVHKDLTWFSQELGVLWGYTGYQKEKRLADSLDQLGTTTFHKPYFSPLNTSLTTNSGLIKGSTVIVFSRLENNMLLAEVSDNQEGGPGLHNIFSTFDQSLLYLFIFRPDGTIQRHYVQHIAYN